MAALYCVRDKTDRDKNRGNRPELKGLKEMKWSKKHTVVIAKNVAYVRIYLHELRNSSAASLLSGMITMNSAR